MELLKTQRNEIVFCIKDSGFNIEDFIFESIQNGNSHKYILKHKNSEFFYNIEVNFLGRYSCNYSPSTNSKIGDKSTSIWMDVVHSIGFWLERLEKELEAPDLWAAFSKNPPLQEIADEYQAEEEFSAEERIKAQQSLAEIKQFFLKSNGLSEDKIEVINQKIDYLIESSNRLGKKDFLNLVGGMLFSLIVSVATNQEQATSLYQFCLQSFNWLSKATHLLF